MKRLWLCFIVASAFAGNTNAANFWREGPAPRPFAATPLPVSHTGLPSSEMFNPARLTQIPPLQQPGLAAGEAARIIGDAASLNSDSPSERQSAVSAQSFDGGQGFQGGSNDGGSNASLGLSLPDQNISW